MATCLYTTVLTDTGGFTYGSVGESTFAMARELVRAGADPIAIARDVCYSATTAKVLILGAALNNLRREGRVAWLWVTHKDVVRTCAAEEDCEGIVNVAVGIAGVEVATFLRELPENRVRLSLRSKGRVNVAEIAEKLGGGGHGNAAGCTLEGPLDQDDRTDSGSLTQQRRRISRGSAVEPVFWVSDREISFLGLCFPTHSPEKSEWMGHGQNSLACNRDRPPIC